ncbi:MAG TPA: hypothetical protein DCR93_23740 [Cytophagales bacterium]|nr:hypothetical protein [Cytophagales bacterium]HAP62379.1 hypothetical protein [Cytophagales bacterium]
MMQNDPKTVFFYLTDHSDGREQIRVRSFLRAFKQANPKDLKIYSLAVNDGDKAQFVGCLWHIQHPDSDRIEDVVDQEIKNFLAQK